MTREIAEFLKGHRRFLVLSHMDPDGDAAGSALGLARVLRDAGKQAQVLLPGGMPELYAFLPGSGDVGGAPGDAWADADAVVVVDATSPSRLAGLEPLLLAGLPVADIDHHPDNTRFGDVNLVDSTACAAALLVLEVAREAGFAVGREAAECLYAGIFTDTGRFTYSNTDARALEAAASLAAAGAEAHRIASRVYGTQSVESVRLLAKALDTLEIHAEGTVACLVVTRQMLEDTGATLEDADGFSNWSRSLRGVKVGVFLREAEDGTIKISFRSNEGVEIDGVAGRFGGGGHARASGARVPGPLAQAKQDVLRAVTEHLQSLV
jgi:phosphoesterase RecJ-like protein